ncbi:uncharacterized protein LOC143465078 [Clavelina lepadiformis]|uniref:Uncharacterized protein n=1 Tax=Clavelina lepadiformis TaxID=159417 RepID=A0ABP0EWY7_CLALP
MRYFVAVLIFGLFSFLILSTDAVHQHQQNYKSCGTPLRTTSTGVLEIPLNCFNGKYYCENTDCTWKIKTVKNMTVNFKSFDVEPTRSSAWCNSSDSDYVTIHDNGSQVGGLYCAGNPPPSFLRLSNDVTIYFHSGNGDSVGKGFDMSWVSEAAPIRDSAGVVTPDWTNGDRGYGRNINRSWEIETQPETTIKLNLSIIDFGRIEPLPAEHWNFFDSLGIANSWRFRGNVVTAYLQLSYNSGEVKRIFYNKTTKPVILNTTSNEVQVKFLSGAESQSGGFELHWEAQAILCPIVANISNGLSSCSKKNEFGSECHHRCKTGFKLVGARSSTCISSSGKSSTIWWPTFPQCEELLCPSISSIENGASSCSKSNQVNSTCEHQCNRGYILTGKSSSSCLLVRSNVSEWSSPLPKCILPTPCPKPLLTYGNSNCTDGSKIYSSCQHQCSEGYKLERGRASSTCEMKNGSSVWVPELPTCEIVSCPRATVFNGTSNCSAFNKLGSKCKHYCERGFQLNGASLTTCIVSNESPMWSPELPNCKAMAVIGSTAVTRIDCNSSRFRDDDCNSTLTTATKTITTSDQGGVNLSPVVYVGCAFSCFFLLATIAIRSYFRKLRQKPVTLGLINICFCLFLVYLFYAVGVTLATNSVTCDAMTFILHVFTLSSWMWMAVDAYGMSVGCAKGRWRLLGQFCIGYVLPFIIVLANFAITTMDAKKVSKSSDEKFQSFYRLTNICWLKAPVLNWGFLLPTGIALLLTLVGIFCAIRNLMSPRMAHLSMKSRLNDQLANSIAVVITTVIVWMFGYWSLTSHSGNVALQVFFALSCALQGLIIFYLNCFRRSSERHIWWIFTEKSKRSGMMKIEEMAVIETSPVDSVTPVTLERNGSVSEILPISVNGNENVE